MEFYETTFFIRDDSPIPRFELVCFENGEPCWLRLLSENAGIISWHLPHNAAMRATVLAGMRDSLNKAIDEADDLVVVDAEAAEPEPVEVAG